QLKAGFIGGARQPASFVGAFDKCHRKASAGGVRGSGKPRKATPNDDQIGLLRCHGSLPPRGVATGNPLLKERRDSPPSCALTTEKGRRPTRCTRNGSRAGSSLLFPVPCSLFPVPCSL